jgi:pectinesterase
MTVSQDGTAEYKSIRQAIDSIPKNNSQNIKIFIKNGVYKEKLFIENFNINLIGENAEKTIITFADYAKKKFFDGRVMGTFNSYTFYIGGNDFKAENITFKNSSGSGKIYGQAIACYVDSDNSYFKNCRFLGNQDTLFTGPLPPSPIIPGSFSGPRENAPRLSTTQYYDNCFIEGDVDFIFGSAKAIFNKCEIFSKNRIEKINGYITAPSTPSNQEFGYVFINCKLTSDADPETVYLGRPWREYAKSVFINCWMGEHIISHGWDNWGKVNAEKTAMFGEYNSTGPGAKMNKRVKWANILTDKEAEKYTFQVL